jgi:ELWxxDGT repeat protein
MKRLVLCLSLFALGYGATAQLKMVSDINPGAAGSFPTRFTALGNRLVFLADDGVNGNELWAIDTSGANLVFNINPGATSSAPFNYYVGMGVVGGKVYFPADNGTHGMELYSWDGITAPMLASDIHAGTVGSTLNEVVGLGGKLYFPTNETTSGIELWHFDPATNTTQRLTDIYPGTTSSNPQNLTVYKGKLFFAANDGTYGNELWTYDPMTNNASRVFDINTGGLSADPQSMVVVGDKLYFAATTSTNGRELYSFDSTNVVRLTDVFAGAGSAMLTSSIGQNRIAGYKGAIFFGGDNGTTGQQLYKYNPLNNSTSLVYKINPLGSSTPSSFITYGTKLYFIANDGLHGTELWMYDGINTPSLVADVDSGANSSFPANLTVHNGALYFNATTAMSGSEVYMYKDSTVGVQNTRFAADVKVYPNPATTEFHIDMKLKNSEKLSVSVCDMTGKEVFSSNVKQYAAGSNRITIPMQHVSTGVYLYRINGATGNIQVSGRIVKE